MNQILRCDWLPEQARWSYLARSGVPTVSRKQNFPKSHINKSFIDQACSVKIDGYWPRSCFGQYPAILTSHLVNNWYGPLDPKWNIDHGQFSSTALCPEPVGVQFGSQAYLPQFLFGWSSPIVFRPTTVSFALRVPQECLFRRFMSQARRW